ncbi:MAG: D-2-hydroxyacid dehydrogenase family protein [Acidiphilium sp.]
MNGEGRMRVAVLDDWQGVAREMTHWSALEARAEIVFFTEAFSDEDDAARQLADFDVLMPMRERTAFPEALIVRLPRLRLFAMTGRRGGSLDLTAMRRHGITICYADGADAGEATAELTLGLILAAARAIPIGDAAIRAGGFQAGVPAGFQLAGKTLGVIGFGRLGSRLARYAQALEMKVLAWSENLTVEKADSGGAKLVSKARLLAESDVISLHLVLSARTKGVIGAGELAAMRQGAILVNTSRGPLVDEAALIAALETGRIVAALDVYDREPLPANHPFRTLPNTILTPHLGYVTAETLRSFYRQGVENVLAFLDGKPIRVLQPEG